jgi:hypothetical protein
MAAHEVEKFGKRLVEWVRDPAIQSNDRRLQAEGVIAKRWRDAATSSTPEEFAKIIIPDIVDSTISQLLIAIDQKVLPLSFAVSPEMRLDLTNVADGLSGEYMGEWRKIYTKERVADDFSHLRSQKPQENS